VPIEPQHFLDCPLTQGRSARQRPAKFGGPGPARRCDCPHHVGGWSPVPRTGSAATQRQSAPPVSPGGPGPSFLPLLASQLPQQHALIISSPAPGFAGGRCSRPGSPAAFPDARPAALGMPAPARSCAPARAERRPVASFFGPVGLELAPVPCRGNPHQIIRRRPPRAWSDRRGRRKSSSPAATKSVEQLRDELAPNLTRHSSR